MTKTDTAHPTPFMNSSSLRSDVLLFCHGFPGTNMLPQLSSSLPSQVSLVSVRYRGDQNTSGAFSFLGSMQDIINTAKQLRRLHTINRLTGLGYSAGGFYLLNIVRSHKKLFDALILINPVTNSYFWSDAPVMDELWGFTQKNEVIRLRSARFYNNETRTMNAQYNPMTFTHEIQTPIALVQSSRDDVVPPQELKLFFELLGSREKYYFPIIGGRHDITGGEKEIQRAIFALR